MASATRAPAARAAESGRFRRPSAGRVALYAFLILLAAIFILPMLWALSASFKERSDIFQYPPKLLPSPATLANYVHLIQQQPFVSWFYTTLIVAVASTAVAVLVCSLAGFAFAKYRFRGKGTLFDIMFSSLAVPYAVVVLPLFVVLTKTGLTEPFFAMIVPWVAPAFGIFMMRQYIEQTVPDEIIEAGRIDGCTEFGIFLRLVLPLLRPALGALAVWNFLNSYNTFLWPLIVVSDPHRYTLALGLATVYGAQSHQVDLVLAGSVLAAIPSLVVFIMLRKQLLDGLTAGSVKN
jgi:multiple sugar transport system permease protein